MRKQKIIAFTAILLAVSCTAGCGREEPELGGLEDVREVANFSQFEETELLTEVPTEVPTEAPTEPSTEPATEAVTETEPPQEPYQEDFDFSDHTVMSAFYSIRTLDNLSRQESFADTVTANEAERVRKISLGDGQVVISMKADRNSGKTNRILEISCSQDYLGAIKEGLIALGAGLDEDNIDTFVLGGYNGENAPYIGLANASCTTKGDGTVSILLEKAKQEDGPIPGAVEGAVPTVLTLEGSFATIKADENENGPFAALLQSVDGRTYTAQENSVKVHTMRYDRDGNLISEEGPFSGQYSAQGRTYSISAASENGKTYLTIAYAQEHELKDAAAIAMAEHLYQYFYHGTFDKTASLASMLQADHATLEKNGNGYILKIG